jgi:hypothetical protein
MRPTLADLADRRDGIVRPEPGSIQWMPVGTAWHDSERYVSPEEELRKYIDWKPPTDVATWNPTGPLREIPPPSVVSFESRGRGS